jgi:tetrahydromethanopterin S-methyltransferase subunit G
MRLLELRGNGTTGATRTAALLQKPVEKLASSTRTLKRPREPAAPAPAARVYPLGSKPARTPSRRKPALDLVALQQRIDELERRIQARLARPEEQVRKDEVEQLRARLKLLERKVESELWSARQREYTLLEMLARRPKTVPLKTRALKLLHTLPPAILCWCKAAGREWWLDCQPLWWPQFHAAWQEALYRARK